MLKHYINIFDNTYYIEKDGVILFSIELENDNIKISTPKQVCTTDINNMTIIVKEKNN